MQPYRGTQDSAELHQLLHRPSASGATIRTHYRITDHEFISTRHPHAHHGIFDAY